MKPETDAPAMESSIPAESTKPLRRTRRAKPGKAALREIKKLQTNDKFVVPRESLRRYIAEVLQGINPELCLAVEAVEAIRVAAETTLTQTFGLAGALTTDLQKKDTIDLASFRAAANILNSEHVFSTGGVVSGALTSPLM